jgi:23S rRNA (uracil1939-C5)-methyltransferase
MADAAEIEIVRLGAQGDGVAETEHGPRFVAFALPGERVLPGDDGPPHIVSAPSRERAAPLCRHFGVCGGCVAQHMSERLYADWKRGILVEAFRQRGLDALVAPLLRIAPRTRRRAVFTTERVGGRTVLGYHRRRSHELFSVDQCPVLVPAIVDKLLPLRAIAAETTASGVARITVLATPAGLDVTVEMHASPSGPLSARLAQIAREAALARLTVNGDTVIERARPTLAVGGVELVAPAGSFLQAVAEAEQVILERVVAAAARAKRVADLFAGIGTLTFALARTARVLAVDGNKAALAVLETAARQASGLKPIETRVRDLFRDPLSPREVDTFDAVVFDPPRAGAKAQAEALARSRVPAVIAVSCNPATLARDARILVDGGYRLAEITPIDQFLFSAHLEAVAVLLRDKPARAKARR